MALLTYADMLIQIPLWLARPTDANIIASVPDFITLAEERIAYGRGKTSQFPSEKLRIRAMETMVPLVLQGVSLGTAVTGTDSALVTTLDPSITGMSLGMTVQFIPLALNSTAVTLDVGFGPMPVVTGSAQLPLDPGDLIPGASYQVYFNGLNFVLLAANSHVPLPPGYLSSRSCYIDINPRVDLDYLTPSEMNKLYPDTGATGTPRAFTVEADCIRFAPAPDTQYFFWLNYFQKFAPLATAGTNWLMTNAASVYLYGTLIETAPFIGHDQRLQLWYSMYQAACDGLQEQDQADRHSGARLRMRAPHSCP